MASNGYPLAPGITTAGTRDPFAPPTDPLKGANRRDAEAVFRDVPVGVVPTWTVSEVRRALTDHQLGMFQNSGALVEAVLADDRVHATLGAAGAAIFSRPVWFSPARGDGIDEAKADECAAAWKEAWGELAGSGAFDTLFRWRKLLGFSIAEVLWNTDKPVWTPSLKFFHPIYSYYRVDTREYVGMTYDGQASIVAGNGKWFLHTPYGAYRGWQLGAIRAIAIPWLTRVYALRDWSRYSEVHGLPIMKAVVPAGGDSGEKERFTSSISQMGQESVVMLPKGIDGEGYDLALLEATDKSWQAFDGLIKRCDTAIVLALLHQNLMTEMSEGSNAAARQHADVRQEEIAFGERTFARDIYLQVARPFAQFNFGNADLAPMTHWDIEPTEDKLTEADILQKFAISIDMLARSGVKVDVAKLGKRFGIDLDDQPPPVPVQGATGSSGSGASGGGSGGGTQST